MQNLLTYFVKSIDLEILLISQKEKKLVLNPAGIIKEAVLLVLFVDVPFDVDEVGVGLLSSHSHAEEAKP